MFLTNCCKKKKDGKGADEDDKPFKKAELVQVHYPRPMKVDPIMEVTFKINGKSYTIKPSDNLPVDTSLNTFIRTHANLTGTKFMCLEGGCGACIVAVHGTHPVTKQSTTWAVNSCLYPVFACHSYEILTIEGIGDKKNGYHDLQKRLAKFNGTQCGYCSPGMVMNMYSLLEGGNGAITMEQVENSFGGNICRCTGYRPILDAFKSVAVDATEDLKKVCGDIEDLGKFCTKMNKTCTGTCAAAFAPVTQSVRLTDSDGKKWFKVASLQELLDTLKANAGKKYMLVNGNTAHGVYRRDDDIEVFIDVNNVDELHTVNITDNGIIFGANVSLTEAMNTLLKAAESKPAFEYCRNVWKHIDLVANVPVRNAGTLAGNLSIKHQHKYFPSDIFLLLETTGATLEITDTAGQKTTVKPSEYLGTDMTGKVITKITLPPLPGDKFLFRSFKVMPRAQNAHAYVNAGFLIEFDEAKMIKNATVVYGGIKPEFIHAKQTEALLKGKDIYTNDSLSAVRDALSNELDPDWVLPDASPDYRKNLAVSLFYKFLLDTCPDGKMKPEYATGGKVLERPLSSGRQDFDTNKNNWPLNQNVQKLEGLIQCAGEAEYVNDLPPQPNQLWGAFVPASTVGSKIIKIDPTEALKLPGVEYFYSAKDIPGDNSFVTKKVFGIFEDEEIFCDEDVRYNGQPCGIILADSFEKANQAAKLVKIVYGTKSSKKILPMLKDVCKANAVGRFKDTGFKVEGKGSATSTTQKIKGHFEMGGQYHFTMETQSCVAVPGDEGLDVYASTQWMDLTQIAIADALNIPNNNINVYTKRLGGAYGCKISRATHIACACALAAYLSHRPVRLVLKIETNMEAIGKRPSVVSDYEVDVESNGKITKLVNNYSEDYGCSINEPVIFGTQGHFPNCYNKDVFTFDGKAVITDSPSNTWCRAPGTTEGIAMIENIMEHVAKALKKDPVQVRLQNIPGDSQMKTILPEFTKDIDYDERRRAINDFNSKNRWRKRGIAVVPMHYNMEYFGTLHALVSIYHGDGTVNITHGGIEMGQGINTKAAQVAAHTLGIQLENVAVKKSNSLTSANDIVTGGSMGSEAIAYAVKKACETLLKRLEPIREKNKNAAWADLVHTAFNENVDLSAYGLFRQGEEVKPYIIWGCAAAEVEIDLLTGNYLLTRVDILEDTGESLSPGVDIGQVEGAFIMGMGYWLQEELVYDNTNGELKTNRTWNYKPPTAKDIPVDFRIKFLHNSSNPFGVLRSKATGEPATCMSIVVLFAVRDAVDAARRDAGLTDPWYPLDAPATVEKIFLACGGATTPSNFILN